MAVKRRSGTRRPTLGTNLRSETMLSKIMRVSFLIGFGSCGVAQCQQASSTETAPAAATSTTPAAAPVQKLVLKEGADVQLKFAQDITSKTAAEGDTVNLVLDQ